MIRISTLIWKKNQSMRVLPLIFTLILYTGCSKGMRIFVNAHENCNNRYPVVLRVYQLKNDTNFHRATIQSLWPDDEKVLASEFIAKEEFTLHPGETKRLEFKLAGETKFIAVCADFHDPDADGWRQVNSIKSLKGKKVWIVCGESKLQIVGR